MAYSDVFNEQWSSNTLASYTFDEGSSTGMSVSGGFLQAASGVAGSGIRTSLTGGPIQRGTISFRWAAGGAGVSAGAVLKRISANNFLMGQVTGPNGAPLIQLYTRVAGAYSNKTNVGISAKSGATDYWWRISISGNDITGEFFTSDPYSGATAAHTTTYTLTGTDATSFGAGVSGAGGFRFGVTSANDGFIDFVRFEQDTGGPAPSMAMVI